MKRWYVYVHKGEDEKGKPYSERRYYRSQLEEVPEYLTYAGRCYVEDSYFIRPDDTKMPMHETTLALPVEVIHDEDSVTIVLNKEGEKLLGPNFPVVASGDTYKNAVEQFWKLCRFVMKYHRERSDELNRWKFFQKGNWNHTGGTWFNLMGLHFYFRRGEDMQGGWYLPFTKLNISFTNYWLK